MKIERKIKQFEGKYKYYFEIVPIEVNN